MEMGAANDVTHLRNRDDVGRHPGGVTESSRRSELAETSGGGRRGIAPRRGCQKSDVSGKTARASRPSNSNSPVGDDGVIFAQHNDVRLPKLGIRYLHLREGHNG